MRDDLERDLLACIRDFAGPVSLEAVLAVMGAPGSGPPYVSRRLLVYDLVDRGLLEFTPDFKLRLAADALPPREEQP